MTITKQIVEILSVTLVDTSVGWGLVVIMLGGISAMTLQWFRNYGTRDVANITANVSLTEQATNTLLEIVKEIRVQNRTLSDENSLLICYRRIASCYGWSLDTPTPAASRRAADLVGGEGNKCFPGVR